MQIRNCSQTITFHDVSNFFRIRRLVLLYIFYIANKPHETTRINNVLVTFWVQSGFSTLFDSLNPKRTGSK